MADTKTNNWEEGDKFVFTESPFPAGKVPTGVHTLGARQSDPKHPFQYFDVTYKLGEITVATHWIKKPGDE